MEGEWIICLMGKCLQSNLWIYFALALVDCSNCSIDCLHSCIIYYYYKHTHYLSIGHPIMLRISAFLLYVTLPWHHSKEVGITNICLNQAVQPYEPNALDVTISFWSLGLLIPKFFHQYKFGPNSVMFFWWQRNTWLLLVLIPCFTLQPNRLYHMTLWLLVFYVQCKSK